LFKELQKLKKRGGKEGRDPIAKKKSRGGGGEVHMLTKVFAPLLSTLRKGRERGGKKEKKREKGKKGKKREEDGRKKKEKEKGGSGLFQSIFFLHLKGEWGGGGGRGGGLKESGKGEAVFFFKVFPCFLEKKKKEEGERKKGGHE